MSFKSHLCFVTRYQVEQHLLEIWVRDKVSEDVDLVLLHQWKALNKEVKVFDEQVVQILLTSKLELLELV